VGNNVSPFVVDPVLLGQLHDLIGHLRDRSRYTTMTVPAAEFPTWCAALDVESFYTYRTKAGNAWVGTKTTHLVSTTTDSEYRMLSVACDTPPAPWVEFPRSEGDRRYMFKYELPNETESQ
jgi:hypothetical protein